MKGSDTKAKGPPSADFLVCFPSRSRLTLMPKPICSPARPSEPNNRHRRHHFIKKLRARNGAGAGQASPLIWAKNKQMVSEITEPTSPKVTCAGQIKVRSKTRSCKSWQSVMEEIERIRNNKNRFGWLESLGFKKEVMQFLTCFRLRSIRFDFQCFGSFPRPDINTEDEGVKDEEHRENHNHADGKGTMFSKWLMVLQDNQSNGIFKEENKIHEVDDDDQTAAPPPNALLLMRCRSAPAKSWLKDEENLGNDEDEECERKLQKKTKNLRSLMEEERLVVLKYDPGFFRAGGLNYPSSRTRSWKR
ncbi:hypothetical protein like AT1G78110 [Hibiscus trionum]|uniref:Uncharacterized protein n=1 Tax=Hibiscus trionum TaxID=183268 RepID=A0A9W7HGX5_HIBTR|nr:hypothetical protein like AT1G78110 [Hibiscus trionum]